MSAIYYYEIIEVKKGNDKKLWFYEGQDLFSGEDYNLIKGSDLELVKLDTMQGNVSIKGTIISLSYIDDYKNKSRDTSILNRLFK